VAVRNFFFCLIGVLALSGSSLAQDSNSNMNIPDMAGMAPEAMNMKPGSLIEVLEQHAISGTDVEPNSTPVEMLMRKEGSWTLMFHGAIFLNDLQQTGPHGADKFFSTNWFMPMAQRNVGHGTLTLRAMLSLEPATVSNRRYPELFQQGETAFGRPIVDGQHPHDFFMELAALYDYKLNEKTLLSFYLAPVGDRLLVRPRILIEARPQKIPLLRWGIISRIPPTSPAT